MIIAFDAKRIVTNRTGLGSYARTLVNDLSAAAPKDCALRLYAPNAGNDELRHQVTDAYNVAFVYARSRCKWWWRSHGIVDDLRRDHVQLYHGLSGELPVGIWRAGIPSVVTIHDLIFMRHPEYYGAIDAQIYKWKFRRTVKEADRIIAISECTKRDIMALGGVDESRISVVYQSCSTHFKQRESEDVLQKVNARYMLPGRYIVSVGTIEERKNIALAVKALPMMPADVGLVIVGRRKPYADRVEQEARRLSVSHRVMMLHDVPNEDLPAIYQMAEACVYPSRYEGFGIPVIEAVQSGLPVVACTGSCLEEAGGPNCLYVDPDDAQAMARAVTSVLKGAEGRDERIERARRYVERFENTDVASQVLKVYDDVLRQHGQSLW